jgi:hypothetical protein
MRFYSDVEDVAQAIVDRYIEPPSETEPVSYRVVVEAKRYDILSDLMDSNRSLEDLFSELDHVSSLPQ